MDFSDGAFRSNAASHNSDETRLSSDLVMACRWGWTSFPPLDPSKQSNNPTFKQPQTNDVSSFNNIRSKRFAPCQGRLYHQLICSHRVRTDLVEDCGTNCVEPFGKEIGLAFICNECVQGEAAKIWEERQTQHNAAWPPLDQMSQEQYHQYYAEHRLLEDEYVRDRRLYELELKSKTRPSNICLNLEATKDELEFANQLDSLALSLMAPSHDSTQVQAESQSPCRPRVNLPSDVSEQLHWNLNSLSLDRGSCGIEYSPLPSKTITGSPARQIDEDRLWRKPREQD